MQKQVTEDFEKCALQDGRALRVDKGGNQTLRNAGVSLDPHCLWKRVFEKLECCFLVNPAAAAVYLINQSILRIRGSLCLALLSYCESCIFEHDRPTCNA